MSREANYFADPTGDPSTYTELKARYHQNPVLSGDLQGTNLSYATTHDKNESVVLLVADVGVPPRNSIAVFSAAEGYVVTSSKPPDGITVTCEVYRAPPQDLVGLTAPDGTVIS